jgi:release factor glutamine methyltransferase
LPHQETRPDKPGSHQQRFKADTPGDTIGDTVAELLMWATDRIAGTCPDTPRLDAEVILASILERDRLWLHLNPDFHPGQDSILEFTAAVERRCNQEPVAYITGWCEFFSRPFRCDKRALIPRPETELIVEQAVSWAGRIGMAPDNHKILDLGTGSGILAITLCLELGAGFVLAVDHSFDALTLARENVLLHGSGDRVHLLCSSWFSAIGATGGAGVAGAEGRFSIIVSNPPYVGEKDRASLPESVAAYEPATALFDGSSRGLSALEEIFRTSPAYLDRPGILLCETGWDQAKRVKAFAEALGVYRTVSIFRDLSGIERVVAAEL